MLLVLAPGWARGGVPERPIGTALKAVVGRPTAGSNPAPSARSQSTALSHFSGVAVTLRQSPPPSSRKVKTSASLLVRPRRGWAGGDPAAVGRERRREPLPAPARAWVTGHDAAVPVGPDQLDVARVDRTLLGPEQDPATVRRVVGLRRVQPPRRDPPEPVPSSRTVKIACRSRVCEKRSKASRRPSGDHAGAKSPMGCRTRGSCPRWVTWRACEPSAPITNNANIELRPVRGPRPRWNAIRFPPGAQAG